MRQASWRRLAIFSIGSPSVLHRFLGHDLDMFGWLPGRVCVEQTHQLIDGCPLNL
jgi:hypothetical protein